MKPDKKSKPDKMAEAYWKGYNSGVEDALHWHPCSDPPNEFDIKGYSALCIVKLEYGGPVVAVYHDNHGWLKSGNEKLVNAVFYRFIETGEIN